MWLVAMALPIQGLAAATMLSCGPGHHRLAAALAAEPADHDHAAHQHHASVSVSAEHDRDSADRSDAAPKDLHQLAKFTCSACAACCVASVLPSAGVTFDPPKQTATFVLPALAPSVRFLTSGQERPPRLLLA